MTFEWPLCKRLVSVLSMPKRTRRTRWRVAAVLERKLSADSCGEPLRSTGARVSRVHFARRVRRLRSVTNLCSQTGLSDRRL